MNVGLRQWSKTISHALRHAPWLYELELDDAGWVPIDMLLAALRRHRHQWHNLSKADLQQLVDTSVKKRFEIKDDRIRARYGHSITSKIRQEPAAPPPILYHGTARVTADSILREGLKPMGRQYVHLSADVATARQVGLRKDKQPLILQVSAFAAHQSGIYFYNADELIWLADAIPPAFIQLFSR